MILRRLALLAILSAVSSFAQDSAPPAPAPSPAEPVSTDPRIRGAQAFASSGCPQCHTIRGNGGVKGPDLSGVGRRLNDEQIRAQIQNGSKQMPAFSDVLQASETDDLVAYLHSLRDKSKHPKK
ncbi:c-type cytochrome [Edaphobacter aggregans]|uniref:c-type cytochrome n=1 Tax=Edaphobacter aggregans TaxID=570835 RepID=UPI00054F32F1|nr:cytochrome c [Edaphobacter aggregans]